jgi:hypothetical protein
MKKLMTLMLGLSLALGSVAVAFGQDEPKKEEKKKGGKKKGEDKKGDEQKKEFR